MKVVRIKPRPMTREAFEPFGILIDTRGAVEIDLGETRTSMTGTTSEWRPYKFEFMARHQRTMQVFSPLVGSQSIVAVAPPSLASVPNVELVEAFLVDGRLPYAFHKGTWHTPPFPIKEWSSYLVVDRSGTLDDDWELVDLRTSHNKVFEIEL
jgi:ureidoglycolate lyase